MPIPQTVSKEKKSSPLDAMMLSQKDNLAAVNALILSRMQSDVPLIPKLAGHLIAGGGKRIRPLLTLASAALMGYKGTRTHKLAACVEFIHTATLLHDDVVDESDQRRGKASANALFGNEAAVLVGDFLFSRSFELMVEDGSLDVLRVLSHASAVIAEGEVLQLSMLNDISMNEESYLKIIGAKTAALFAAACQTGGLAAGATAQDCQKLYHYGYNLGLAFQISDDVLDYSGNQADLGKSIGDDFKEGKVTLPVILALQSASAEEKIFWQRCVQEVQQNDGDFIKALGILQKHDSLNKSLSQSHDYAVKAVESLKGLPDTHLREVMTELAFYAVNRSS